MAPKDKKDKKNKAPSASTSADPITTDPRFARVHSDPRFIKSRKDAAKVTIDNRFAEMLKSDEFGTGSAAPSVDKYGRRTRTTAKRELQRFYKLDDETNEPGTEEKDELESEVEGEGEKGESSDVSMNDERFEGDFRAAGYDLARGEGLIESDSESDEDEGDTFEEATEENLIDIGPYAEETVPTGEETYRFAVVNMDWDFVKAKDLFKVFDAFTPAQGTIKSVKVYPSEFGMERLEREAREGPPADIFEQSGDDELSRPLIQAEDGTEDFDNIKLRKYQLERLKYYYAVVECDSVETARHIYKTCDGTEYEKSANFFDLRYIPDDMTFDDKPNDETYEAPAAYQSKEFVTHALQHSKVKLTWDEDDDERIRVTRRKFTRDDLKDMDFKAYLASASEDEDEDEDVDAIRSKYQALLGGAGADGLVFGSKEKEEELEITFAPGLSEKAAALLEKKKEEQAQKDETVFEAYLRKRKEKRKAKKLAQKADDEDPLVSSGDERSDFDDPFFDEEFGEDYKPKSTAKRNGKETKKSQKNKETLEHLKSRAELELLMVEEGGPDSRHFDMKEVIKQEKNQKRKKKGRKGNKEDKEGAVQDGFQINVTDPRFSGILESHHFAIDPTNPHFKKTTAMETLLDERRKRREKDNDVNSNVRENQAQKSSVKSNKGAPGKMDLSHLVDSVKRKSAAALDTRKGKRQKK